MIKEIGLKDDQGHELINNFREKGEELAKEKDRSGGRSCRGTHTHTQRQRKEQRDTERKRE